MTVIVILIIAFAFAVGGPWHGTFVGLMAIAITGLAMLAH